MTAEKGNQALIRLSRDERRVLLEHFNLPPALRTHLAELNADSADVWMSTDEAEDLREQAGELFQLLGLNSEMQPTPTGIVLDALIDKLFAG